MKNACARTHLFCLLSASRDHDPGAVAVAAVANIRGRGPAAVLLRPCWRPHSCPARVDVGVVRSIKKCVREDAPLKNACARTRPLIGGAGLFAKDLFFSRDSNDYL